MQDSFLDQFRTMSPNAPIIMRKPMFQYSTEFLQNAPKELATSDDLVAHRKYMLENGPFIDVPERPKCNQKAAEVRQSGNRLWLKKDYKASLEKYNESICLAEVDSEDLGIGYANRSAVYFEIGEHAVALANIALAKKHNYPQRIMPKLLAREINCLVAIASAQSKRNPITRLKMHAEVNPKIPFLAKGIRLKQLPDFGRSMITERDLKVGEVVLHEKPMMAVVAQNLKYLHCDCCTIENFHSLIPCPKCASVMFCSEDCREKGQQLFHRFECGIYEKLHHVSYGRTHMGPRAFFLGLGLFKDSPEEMKAYCEANAMTGGDPWSLDYSKYDAMDDFKVFLKVKVPSRNFRSDFLNRFYATVYYSIFINQPLVKSMLTTESQQQFMHKCFLDFMRMSYFLYIGNWVKGASQLFTFASVCNHSCDPNAMIVYRCGQLRLVVVRPISKGEQILISYGPRVPEDDEEKRRRYMEDSNFDCLCTACDKTKKHTWLVQGLRYPDIPRAHLSVLGKVLAEPTVNIATKLNALQQFIERYSNVHPRDELSEVLMDYQCTLIDAFDAEVEAATRAKFAAIYLE